MADNITKAIFAAGCFWGVESKFMKVKGVLETEVGYIGGNTQSPTYEDVCFKNTGHVEAVLVMYDKNIISYEDLLNVFWSSHDPTTKDRQGVDVGSQYRSVVFYLTQEQKEIAEKKKEELNSSGTFSNTIVTEIIKASEFFKAEDYHQKYLQKRGVGTCNML